ncbi:MAG: MmgE/PrpD family protein [Alphaproteobacteria bacterium]
MTRAPITSAVAAFVSDFDIAAVPAPVLAYARMLVFDGIGTLAAATHSLVTSSAGIGRFAEMHAGAGPATLIGQNRKADVVTAALANGTRGYAVDMEPHHPEAILHPVAVLGPVALALCEAGGRPGRHMIGAVVLGCEITYRVSMAMRPRELYSLGFHPSAVCGTFGAAAAASWLLGLDAAQTARALGLAGLQASGLMAWEDDPREDARPFQIGMAARNGVTAALLAGQGFGGPDRIFDGGHNVLHAFSRVAEPGKLVEGLGEAWDGVAELAIKPYPCVSFLHPALDALAELIAAHDIHAEQVEAVALRFAASGAHCVDDNPLKSHCAQYVLPVRLARGGLVFTDLFQDLRESDAEVARLAAATRVDRDAGEFDRLFPDVYAGEVTLTLKDGHEVSARRDVARGYPETPLSQAEVEAKFDALVGAVADDGRRQALKVAAADVLDAPSVDVLAALLSKPANS